MRLNYKAIKESTEKFLLEADGRRKGEITSVKTGIPALDNVLMDGVFWNRIFSIVGMSGSGKSVLSEMLKHGMLDSNENIDVLSFELEMLATDQVARRVSASTEFDFKKLYSIKEPLGDEDFMTMKKEADKLKAKPIYYVDEVASAKDIRDTVIDFAKAHKLKERDRGLIVTIDHMLLTKGSMGNEDRNKIVALYDQLIYLKKTFDAYDMKIIIIPIGQLNRKITDPERIMNHKLHYPMEGDIFGSSSVYNGSDIVLVTHNPSKIKGLDRYGPDSLPIHNPSDTSRAMIYWHLIKYRFNTEALVPMFEDFKHSQILEYKSDFIK